MKTERTELEDLQARIERYFAAGADAIGDDDALGSFIELRNALEAGKIGRAHV